MRKSPIIYLDMDGVVANFVKAACDIHGKDYNEIINHWPKGEYEIHRVLGLDAFDFWSVIDEAGSTFWSTIQPYIWCKEFYMELKNIGDVYFLTSPSLHPNCLYGKLRWLQTLFDGRFRKFIFTPHKHLLANSNCILIDDSEYHVNNFIKAGGNAILFPQPWNSANQLTNIDQIISTINEMINAQTTY